MGRNTLTELTFVYVCDDELGECQGVFKDGVMLGCWADHDANWRNEYFAPFMAQLGFKTIVREATKDERDLIAKAFGW